MIDGAALSYIAELKREIGGLREEIAVLRAKVERMEGDIQILYDKWTLDPALKAAIERGRK